MKSCSGIRCALLAILLLPGSGPGALAAEDAGVEPQSSRSAETPVGAVSSPPTSPEPDQGRIGVRLFQRLDGCFVQEVGPDSPAAAAGLRAGDRLFAVGETSLDGLTMPEITSLIKGPPETSIVLTLRSPGEAPREASVMRAVLPDSTPAVRVARTATPRLKAYAGRNEIPAMLGALTELRAQQVPEEVRAALPVVLAALDRSSDPAHAEQRAALLEEALRDAADLPALVSYVRTLTLLPQHFDIEAKDASASNSLSSDGKNSSDLARIPSFDPRAALRISAQQQARLREHPRLSRSGTAALAAWELLEAEARLVLGQRWRGFRMLERALKTSPGERLALLEPDGRVAWSRQLGPGPLERRAHQLALVLGDRTRAQALEREQAIWGQGTTDPAAPAPDPGGASSAPAPVARPPSDVPGVSGEAWPVSGAAAPGLTLVDTAGLHHRLESLRGKVVLVSLWATWCGPCQKELEAFRDLYLRYRSAGLEILAVSQDQERERVKPFVDKKQLPFPAGFAVEPASLYRASNIPVSLLIDRRGQLAWSHVGFSDDSFAELERKLKGLLEAPPGVKRALVTGAYGIDRLTLRAYHPASRTRSVTIAEGPQGPELWALQASGDLMVLEWAGQGVPRPPSADDHEPLASLEPEPAPLAETQIRRGYGGYVRTLPVDLIGDRLSDRLLLPSRDGNVVVEASLASSVRLFIPSESRVEQAVAVDLDGDRRDEVVLAYGEHGCRAVDGEGRTRWWNRTFPCVGVAKLEPSSTEPVRLLLTEPRGVVHIVAPDGTEQARIDAAAPIARAVTLRRSRGRPPAVVAAAPSLTRLAPLDLNGDGTDELAVLDGPDRLYVLDADGTLLTRLSLSGSRHSLDAGDLDLDGRDELVVSGEGLGVLVLGQN